jgi:hypothetical protein
MCCPNPTFRFAARGATRMPSASQTGTDLAPRRYGCDSIAHMPRILSAFLLLVTLAACASSRVHATPQIPDTLIYQGREYPVANDLMHDYFVKFPEKNPKIDGDWCSGLWKGYRSTYEIIDRRIFLKDIRVGGCRADESALSRVVQSGTLAIDWYSGLLEARYGNNLADPYSIEFLDAFEKYSVFQITDGRLDEVRHFNNKEFLKFKKLQFEEYKKTKEYADEIKEGLSNGGRAEKDVSFIIQLWVVSHTKKFLVK